jgi:hypothetical protein
MPTRRDAALHATGLKPGPRARSLYGEIGRSPAHVEVALRALGYGPRSGGGRVILAALKKFGLIEDEGSRDRRQVKLTPLALRIMLDEREQSPEREAAIKTAALSPAIHRELRDRYPGSLPGDETISTFLRVDRAFTDSAVKEFVPQFRATMAFAKLDVPDTLSRDDEDKDDSSEGAAIQEHVTTPTPTTLDPPKQLKRERSQDAPLPVNVPLARGGWATLQISERMTDAEWDQFMAVLTAMKPGLVTSD